MPPADKANPTIGNGTGGAEKITAAGGTSEPLKLPPRTDSPADANLPTLAKSVSRAVAAAPKLAQLFGRDHHRSMRPGDYPLSAGPLARLPESATPREPETPVAGNRVVIGVLPKSHAPDSTVFDPANLPDRLLKVYHETRGRKPSPLITSTSDDGNLSRNQVAPMEVALVQVAQVEIRPNATSSAPSPTTAVQPTTPAQEAVAALGTETKLQQPRSNPTPHYQPPQGATTARAEAHDQAPPAARIYDSIRTTVETLRNAVSRVTDEKPQETSVIRASLAELLPAVQALSSSPNVYVRHAASTVVVVLREALRGTPPSPSRIAEAEVQINRIERGVGAVPPKYSTALLDNHPLLQHDRRLPAGVGIQRSFEICKESLNIVRALQGIEAKLAPEAISRPLQVMAKTVARHIAPLSKQLTPESASVASHLSELSRSLTAIASRTGRVDLRAFTLRLEGLLHVLALHMLSPRIKQDSRGDDAGTRELFQQISAHLTALNAYRTGRRPPSPGGAWAELEAGAEGDYPGLLLELLVRTPGPGLDKSPTASTAAERLAQILRATPL